MDLATRNMRTRLCRLLPQVGRQGPGAPLPASQDDAGADGSEDGETDSGADLTAGIEQARSDPRGPWRDSGHGGRGTRGDHEPEADPYQDVTGSCPGEGRGCPQLTHPDHAGRGDEAAPPDGGRRRYSPQNRFRAPDDGKVRDAEE